MMRGRKHDVNPKHTETIRMDDRSVRDLQIIQSRSATWATPLSGKSDAIRFAVAFVRENIDEIEVAMAGNCDVE